MDENRLINTSELPLERELIRAAAEEIAPSAVRRRALGALGLLAVTPSAVAVPTSSPVASMAKSIGISHWIAKLGLVVAVGGIVTAGANLYSPRRVSEAKVPTAGMPIKQCATPAASASAQHTATDLTVEGTAAERSEAVRSSVPLARQSSVPPSAHSSTPKPSRAVATPVQRTSGAAAARAGRLRDEVALLDLAREAIAHGARDTALPLLSEYAARHPEGELRAEAAALLAEAMRQGTPRE